MGGITTHLLIYEVLCREFMASAIHCIVFMAWLSTLGPGDTITLDGCACVKIGVMNAHFNCIGKRY